MAPEQEEPDLKVQISVCESQLTIPWIRETNSCDPSFSSAWCGCSRFSAGRAQSPKFIYVDIQPQANGKLADLPGIPKGKHTFAGVKLKIGDGLMVVACDPRNDPGKVEGIKVGTTFRKLHFLHACHYGTPVADTIIGYYTVTYEDKSQETIALVYGKDIANWWYDPREGGLSRGARRLERSQRQSQHSPVPDDLEKPQAEEKRQEHRLWRHYV